MCQNPLRLIYLTLFQPSSLWGNKNWAPQYKDGKFREQNWLYRGGFFKPSSFVSQIVSAKITI